MADRSFTLSEEDLSPRFASAVRAQTRGVDLYLAMGPDRRVRVPVGPRAFAEAIEQWIETHGQEVVVTVDDFEAVAHLRYGAVVQLTSKRLKLSLTLLAEGDPSELAKLGLAPREEG